MVRILIAADLLGHLERRRIHDAAEGWATVVSIPQDAPEAVYREQLLHADIVLGWPRPDWLEASTVGYLQLPSIGFDAYAGAASDGAGLAICNAQPYPPIPRCGCAPTRSSHPTAPVDLSRKEPSCAICSSAISPPGELARLSRTASRSRSVNPHHPRLLEQLSAARRTRHDHQEHASMTPHLTTFEPLKTILTADDFDRGTCGWCDLTPNFTLPGFEARQSVIDKTQWGPIMLSSATFPYLGTHGSMHGTYSLKLSTRPVARAYEQPPAPGSMSHAIKRLTRHAAFDRVRMEMWYSYTPHPDRVALGEKDIRAFGVFLDVQDSDARYFAGARYLNSVDGALQQRWQVAQAAEVSDSEWAYGTEGDWCRRGVDPQWYGRRYADGRTDGFVFVPDGEQRLCYNESDDKINWQYLSLTVDLRHRRYVSLRSGATTFDLAGIAPTLVPPYARIDNLLNPVVWVENDTDRSVSLLIDAIVVSAE